MDVWVDGQAQRHCPVTDRGLAYGDGLFETFAVRRGKPLLLERHLQRLQHGCRRLAIDVDLSAVEQQLLDYCQQYPQTAVLKLIVTRGDSLRGYAVSPEAQPRLILMGYPAAPSNPQHARQGIRLYPCKTRLAEQPLLAGLKHLNRLEQVLARAEWCSSDYAEGLLCDSAQRVIEGVFSNIFIVKDQILITPALQRCGVAGVMRAELLDQAQAAGIAVQVRDIAYQELQGASEVFVCNSLNGIWPVVALADWSWPIGPITQQLQVICRALLELPS